MNNDSGEGCGCLVLIVVGFLVWAGVQWVEGDGRFADHSHENHHLEEAE